MSKPRRDKASFPLDGTPFVIKQRKAIPHEFVLDAMAPLSSETRSMFGCLAVYVQDKLVLILRDKRDGTADNGVWLATTKEHHQSLRREFPNMRSIQVFGKMVTGWQVFVAVSWHFNLLLPTPPLGSWKEPDATRGVPAAAEVQQRLGTIISPRK